MAPWNSHGSAYLQDGIADPRIVNDYYAYTDIAIGATTNSFSITTLPTLPYSAFLTAGTGNPMTISGSNTQTVAPNLNGGAFNLTYNAGAGTSFPINFTKAGTPTTWADDPLIISTAKTGMIPCTRARLTSMGWKLTYT